MAKYGECSIKQHETFTNKSTKRGETDVFTAFFAILMDLRHKLETASKLLIALNSRLVVFKIT